MPRIETQTRTMYQFAELSDEAKETARDWFRGCVESDEIDNDSDDRDTIAAILGIESAIPSDAWDKINELERAA